MKPVVKLTICTSLEYIEAYEKSELSKDEFAKLYGLTYCPLKTNMAVNYILGYSTDPDKWIEFCLTCPNDVYYENN